MPRKPNYNFERAERTRLKAAKKAARLEAKAAKSAAKKADADSEDGTATPAADEGEASRTED